MYFDTCGLALIIYENALQYANKSPTVYVTSLPESAITSVLRGKV